MRIDPNSINVNEEFSFFRRIIEVADEIHANPTYKFRAKIRKYASSQYLHAVIRHYIFNSHKLLDDDYYRHTNIAELIEEYRLESNYEIDWTAKYTNDISTNLLGVDLLDKHPEHDDLLKLNIPIISRCNEQIVKEIRKDKEFSVLLLDELLARNTEEPNIDKVGEKELKISEQEL